MGDKRPEFREKVHEFLINASMQDAYTLYRTVKIGCECPENYKAFDTFLETKTKTKSKM